MLRVEELQVSYGDICIVKGASFHIQAGEWLMIIGPNGAGKSTLVGAVSQSLPYSGRVLFHGEDISRWKQNKIARHMGVLMQSNNPGYSFTVEEVVRLGRYAYSTGILSDYSDEDIYMVEQAMRKTGTLTMREQSVLTLSGGELQRAFLAQIIAQDPRLMILDEPANHLDPLYQKQVFNLVKEWLKGEGRAAVSVVHDLSLARAYGTHAMLMDRGEIIAFGGIDEVMTRRNLEDVYSLDIYAWMRTMLMQWDAAVI